MNWLLERFNRVLDLPLDVLPRVMLVAAALLLLSSYFLPLARLELGGPAHVRSSQVEIYLGDRSLQDPPGTFPNLRWMPFAVGLSALLFLRSAVLGKLANLVDVTVLYLYFLAFGVWAVVREFGALGRGSVVSWSIGSGSLFLGVAAIVLVMALTLAWALRKESLVEELRTV
jgi:hypothetical protein